MIWIVIIAIGAIIGASVGFVSSTGVGMPRSLTLFIAIAGAVIGGILVRFTGFMALGEFTTYIAATVLSIALVAGSILAFSLTNEEKRV